MHIAHINLASGFSGGERQTLILIEQQLREKIQVTVIANPKSIFVDKVRELGVEPILIQHYLLGHHKAFTEGCDLIHVHEGRAIYWAYLQSKRYKIPYIVTRRIDNPFKAKLLSRLAYQGATAIVGLSQAILSQIETSYPQQHKVLIPSSPVVYPVDSENAAIIKQRFSGKFIVIQASNLLMHKGHQTTIEVARRLEKKEPNIQFVFLGDGEQMKALQAQADQLSNITFMGKQTNMGDWFNVADLFIHPSYSEGLGSVILEAMQEGVPVVASNAGGIPDIVQNNITGLLVEARQIEPLADAIASMKNNEQLRETCINGARQMLCRFNIDQTSQQYYRLYSDIASARTC